MFNPADFLKPAEFKVTPAAAMILIAIEQMETAYNLQATIQTVHMGKLREKVPAISGAFGGVIVTDHDYCLRVIDTILPDDLQRRTYICVDTEVDWLRVKMFRESGLFNRKGD